MQFLNFVMLFSLSFYKIYIVLYYYSIYFFWYYVLRLTLVTELLFLSSFHTTCVLIVERRITYKMYINIYVCNVCKYIMLYYYYYYICFYVLLFFVMNYTQRAMQYAYNSVRFILRLFVNAKPLLHISSFFNSYLHSCIHSRKCVSLYTFHLHKAPGKNGPHVFYYF